MIDRYDTENSIEGQFQPGSDKTVLKNKLSITDSNEMDEIELDLLVQLTDAVLDEWMIIKRRVTLQQFKLG